MSTALVRAVPSTFANALARHPSPDGIDVARARAQHDAYVRALIELGVSVRELPGEEGYPDCCFIEDTAVVVGKQVLITRPGAASRRGEEQAVYEALSAEKQVTRMEGPAHLDGGDVLRVGDTLYVGRSERTHSQGLALLEEVFSLHVVPLEVRDALHLKSFSSAPFPGWVVIADGFLDPHSFPRDVEVLRVPREEASAANLVGVGDTVLIHEGHPKTRRALESRGVRCISVDVSEFSKADGSLTCLSLFL